MRVPYDGDKLTNSPSLWLWREKRRINGPFMSVRANAATIDGGTGERERGEREREREREREEDNVAGERDSETVRFSRIIRLRNVSPRLGTYWKFLPSLNS